MTGQGTTFVGSSCLVTFFWEQVYSAANSRVDGVVILYVFPARDGLGGRAFAGMDAWESSRR